MQHEIPGIAGIRKFREALASEKGALGPFMITFDPAFVEASGYVGYDFVLIDMEHGSASYETLTALVRAANNAGVCPVVRVPRGTDIFIGRALDVGSGAVMVPQIDNAEQAREAVAAAKFPPVGTRGASRFVRGACYGTMPGAEFFTKAQESMVIIQAEGKAAVENLDEILDVPGIDVLFIGPYDLSGTLGHMGEVEHPEVIECIKGIIAKAQAKGVCVGCYADSVAVGRKWRDLGVKFIGYNCDVNVYARAAAEDVAEFAK